MKVTYNWLKDFVDLKMSPKELADKLTMAGLEVVSLEGLGGGDSLFEIEITSNRPDWLSILGVAREISAIIGSRLKTRQPSGLKAGLKALRPSGISVADRRDCPFYSALVIRDVKVSSSPDWIKKRLESLGCRSINNIVDITNYILFELGQPLHAFDLDKLVFSPSGPEVVVRRAAKGEEIALIDGSRKLLDEDILVIAANKPVALAGIMGGKETEVTGSTVNILLESAVFDPVLVRRCRQKLGLQSESAYRFERGVDAENAKNASFFALELICKLASGKPFAYKNIGSIKPARPAISLEANHISGLLGTSIPLLKAKRILSGLGFTVKTHGKGSLMVKAPSFRQDIKTRVDLIEEIVRIYGYDKIPSSLPAVKPRLVNFGVRDIVSGIKTVLRGLGVQEAITYSLVDRLLLEKFGVKKDGKPVEILNPLSKEQEVLRFSLLPSLSRALAHNLNQQQERVALFEIANIFSDRTDSPAEELSLGIALCGTKTFFARQGVIKDEISILHMKGILETLFNKLGIKSYDFIPGADNRISIIVDRQEAGFMLALSNQAAELFDIKNKQVLLAEIDLRKLLAHINPERKFASIPKYPAITRGISFVIKEDVSVKDLLMAIEEKGGVLLSLAKVVDYYQGRQIPAGFKGLTISCVYRASERTLTEEEVTPLHDSVRAWLEERFGIRLRQAA
jgi:phenylalanyl-tRNA synthetase beta chain